MFKRSKRKLKPFLSRTKPSAKLAILALGLLAFFIISGKMVIFIADLSKPFSKDILTEKRYTWDGKTSINVAIKSSSVAVLNYDPLDKKVVVMKIPDDTYFDLPKDMGEWRAGAIYDLGQEEKPPVGSELLKKSLSKLLGLPIDGFITLKGDAGATPVNKLVDSLRGNPLQTISFMKKMETDLTPLETFSLLRDLSSVRPDKISVVDISQSDITKSTLLPDSSRVLGVDSVKLDLFVRKEMADPSIENEGKSIAIFNATTHPGLALQASREVTNLGGNVIFTATTDQELPQSIIVYSGKSITGDRLAQIYAPQCLPGKCQSTDPKITSSRADINIVLGEDYFKGL